MPFELSGVPSGEISALRRRMPTILENAEQKITPLMRDILAHLWEEWQGLTAAVERVSADIARIGDAAACDLCGRSPGVGPLVATATVAAISAGTE